MLHWMPSFHWEFDASWIAVVILLVAYVMIVGMALDGFFPLTNKYSTFRMVSVVVCVVVFAAGFATVSWFTSRNFDKETSLHDPSARDVSVAMGLESGKEYPLIMGSRVGGSSVEAGASAGIFSARAYVNTKPASAVSLGFTVGERSWILELPVSAVTFIQSDVEKASVRMVFADTEIYRDVSSTKVRTFGPTKCHLHNLFWVCPRETLSSEITVKLGESTARKGLPPIVSEYLDSAVITLTPAMYKDVLGLP